MSQSQWLLTLWTQINLMITLFLMADDFTYLSVFNEYLILCKYVILKGRPFRESTIKLQPIRFHI